MKLSRVREVRTHCVFKLPFGEELTTQGGRSPQLGYVGDATRQKFTLKERDIETGLDYLGARYYASMEGRFTSADDFFKDSQPEDPQSWNKHTYVRNNPLALVDPNGEKVHIVVTTDPDKKQGTITLVVNFAVVATKGVTKEQAQAAADKLKAQIEATG